MDNEAFGRALERDRRAFERASGMSTASWGKSGTRGRRETKEEWIAAASAILDGLERRLGRSAPQRQRLRLQGFKARLLRPETFRYRDRFKRELDRFVQNAPHVKMAADRYIADMCKPITRMAKRTVRLMKKVRANQTSSCNAAARKPRRK